MSDPTRRDALALLGGVAALAPGVSAALSKPIPGKATVPVIGMGTWQTFNVGNDRALLDQRTEVLRAFFAAGGGMVDSSPMYGSSQDALGYALRKLGTKGLFSADKIWTRDGGETKAQLAETQRKWGVERFDLMQVHNLLAWQDHLRTLLALKAEGRVRYVGVTTSHGRRHGDLAKVLQTQPVDFVQLTYNMTHRAVEDRLLPIAKERGIAVIANRPFDGGALVKRLKAKSAPLPEWAAEWGIRNWPQFLLKWIVSHPAVTVAIPATTRVDHMNENMGAATGRLPDADTRKKMLAYLLIHQLP